MDIRKIIKEELSKFNIPAGTIIKKDAIPFRVEEDTIVSGTDGNAKIAKLREYIRRVIKEDLLNDKSDIYKPGYEYMLIDTDMPSKQIFFRSKNGAINYGKTEIGRGFGVFKIDQIVRL